VLARVIGLFSGRGYNIDSLTVAETDHASHLSRITIVTTGTPAVIEQIKAQLGRLVPVHDVHDLTVEGAHLERELALIKVVAKGEPRVEALPDFVKLAEAFGAKGIKCSDPADLDEAIKEMLAYDGPVIFDCLVEKHENCFPMIPSGKPHNEMLLGEASTDGAIGATGAVMV
jgi:acetolactate synthase small subunit